MRLKVEITFTIPQSYFDEPRSTYNYLFGTETTGAFFNIGWLYNGSNIMGNVYTVLTNADGSKNNLQKTGAIKTAGTYTITLDATGALLDGERITTNTAPLYEGEGRLDLFLMGINASPASQYCALQIKECKIWSDYQNENSLIADYVPVRKKDGTICMYNEVADTYLMTTDGQEPLFG